MMMADPQRSDDPISQAGRALIDAMRSLAATSPACARQRRDQAANALALARPRAISSECIGDIAEVVSEIFSLAPPAAILAPPERKALLESELHLIAATAALQRGEICEALEELTLLCGSGRIGRLLFPLKSLAFKLDRAGIGLTPIGRRAFRVIAGAARGETLQPGRRPQLRVAT